ncbi:MAG TPA: ComEC/Rec2 family competence protein, partial [Vicinamibacteria bacterium]|nr:ComEC/Rec2 family competence protein [Vicinamibacteria bacterium]
MRRPLLAGAALFGVGCLATDGAGERGEVLALLLFAALLIALVPFVRGRALALALAAATVALGAAAVRVESAGLQGNPLRRLASSADEPEADDVLPVRLVGVLRGDAFDSSGRLGMVLDVEAVETGGRRQPVSGRVRLSVGGVRPRPALVDGDRVAVWARLVPPAWEAPRDGTVAFAYCKSMRLVEPLGRARLGPLRRAADLVRHYAREAITHGIMPGPERGLVLAMVLGDRSEIDEATAEAFRASGTYHVLALSGAQVALVAGLIVALLRLLRVAPWPQALLTGSAVCFYALLVGGDLPVVRAALMASALVVGRALEVDGDAANLLGFAALLLMLHRPACVGDVGFQLSFAATLGILMLAGPLARGVPRLPLRVDVAVTASLAAQASLGPILAAAFHRLAPAAVLLNLAAVPLSSAALLSGLAVVLAWPLGEAVARAVGLLAWLAGRALRASGDLGPFAPWLDVRVPTPSLGLLALHACGLVLLARGRRTSGLLLLAGATAGLVLGPFRPAADGRLHLTMIDVGEGDSLLLR